MGHLTLLWTEAPEAEVALLTDVAAKYGADVLQTDTAAMAAVVLGAMAVGGVAYIAIDADDANRALRLGADEVVRLGHLTRQSVSQALDRASMRADARAARMELAARAPDAGSAASLLGTALGHEMSAPLSAALRACDILNDGLPGILDLQERLVGWATLAAPKAELDRLRTAAAKQPNPSELQAMVSDLRRGIDRATRVATLVRRLCSEDERGGMAGAADVIADVHELLHGVLDARATVRVDLRGACLVRVGRPTLALFLAALFAHAIEALRLVPRATASVALRASEEEDAVLVELEHNGRTIPPDLRPGVLEPYFRRDPGRSGGELTIEGLQRSARSLGGELLVLSERPSTTLRLVLPREDLEVTLDTPNLGVRAAPKARLVD